MSEIWPLQLRYADDAWKVFVVCILLNRARGEAAAPVAAEIFRRYPVPGDLALARGSEVIKIVRPLGLQNVRASRLIYMTHDYLTMRGRLMDGTCRPSELYGLGGYADDSYDIFVRKDFSIKPTDLTLIRYLEDHGDD